MSSPPPAKAITSLANPLVKEIRGLSLPKNRKASGLFLAEGLKLVTDGLEEGWKLRTLVYSAQIAGQPQVARVAAAAGARGAEVVTANEAVLGKIARRDNPQTVIGVFEQKLTTASSIKPEGVWIALEAVRDPGNLGTIVRTADAVGASGVILVGDTVDPFSLEAVRATMGSIFHVTLSRTNQEGFLALRKRWPGTVVGTHLEGSVDYRSAEYRGPVLLVMGNEQAGLTPMLASACDMLVRIPMAGRADSLNLAIATGVMLFEIRRADLNLEPGL